MNRTIFICAAALCLAWPQYGLARVRAGAKRAQPAPAMQPLVSAAGTLLIEPDMGRAPVLAAINGAKSTIDLVIYEITDAKITDALVKAAKRGVKVRVLYNYYSFKQAKHDPNAKSLKKLEAAGIETRKAQARFAHTHQKTFVFDGSSALVMTFNLNPQHFRKMRDFGLLTSGAQEVGEISRFFEADWGGSASPAPAAAALVWSPDNARARILAVINGAAATLEVYSEEALDRESLKALAGAAGRGVKVRFLMPHLKSKEKKDVNASGRRELSEKGVQARSGKTLYYHAKMVLADRGAAGQKAFLGSQNLSLTSLDQNRELGIIVEDGAILNALGSVFESDWSRN
jgi:phosphatidylserine/phosphatidylglycerophosphate/cardiolipin synthase-like enzyme